MYYQLIHKIWRDNEVREPQLVLLGDRFQSIFQYNGSDSRFLTLGDKLFGYFNRMSWKFFELNQTFRFTSQISGFINNCVLGFNRLWSKSHGPEPTYVVTSTLQPDFCVKQIKYYISIGIMPHDIFVISYSVKSSMAVRNICNSLASNNIPVFMSEEGGRIDNDNIMRGKVIVSTIHQVKGRECSVAFIIGFDSSLYYFDKSPNKYACPNTMYVALTRAKKHLFLLQNYQDSPLQFVNMSLLPYFAKMVVEKKQGKSVNKDEQRQTFTSAVLTSHLSSHLTNEIFRELKTEAISPCASTPHIINKMKQRQTREDVTNITMQAIAEFLAMKIAGKNHMLQTIRRHNPDFLTQNGIKLSGDLRPEQLLLASNYYLSIRTGHDYKMAQIKQYDWLSDGDLEAILEDFSRNCLETFCRDRSEVVFNFSTQQSINNESVSAQYDVMVESADEQVIINFAFSEESTNQAVLKGVVGYQALVAEVEHNRQHMENLRKELEKQEEKLQMLEARNAALAQGWKAFNTVFQQALELEKGKTCKKGDFVMFVDSSLQVMLSQVQTSGKTGIRVKQVECAFNDAPRAEEQKEEPEGQREVLDFKEVTEKVSHDQVVLDDDGKKVFISQSNPMHGEVKSKIVDYEMFNSVKRDMQKTSNRIKDLKNQLQYSKLMSHKNKRVVVYVMQGTGPNLVEVKCSPEAIKRYTNKMISAKTSSSSGDLQEEDFLDSCLLNVGLYEEDDDGGDENGKGCNVNCGESERDSRELQKQHDSETIKRFLNGFEDQYEVDEDS